MTLFYYSTQLFLGADVGNTGIGGQLGFERNAVFLISALHHYRRYTREPGKFGKPEFAPLKPCKLRNNAGETKGDDVCIFHHKDGHIPGHMASRGKELCSSPCSHKLLSAPKIP